MKLDLIKTSVTYSSILKLSLPIMIGSAVQNLITLTDTIFLGRVGEVELGAIGLVGVFYLMIASIGYSFSKAGQIMIARRVGEKELSAVARITHSMLTFAFLLATFMFIGIKLGSFYFFSLFVKDQMVLDACLAYLDYRAYGVFFSYIGVIIIAFYTGISRTRVIIYNAVVLGIVNTGLNYGLIFGNWGLPKMGIAGAGLASSIAEAIAFLVFVVFIAFDKETHKMNVLNRLQVDWKTIKQQLNLSLPIVLQTVVGIGSWFIFFIIVERMGTTELAVSNIVRSVYLVFMIPCWGYASGVNTIVSNLIGQGKITEVMPAASKTAFLCFGTTMLFALSLILFPEVVLSISTDNTVLIQKAISLTFPLLIIVAVFAVGGVFFNSLIGTGATTQALRLQILSAVLYLVYLYIITSVLEGGLVDIWYAELYYWVVILLLSLWYLRSGRWKKIQL